MHALYTYKNKCTHIQNIDTYIHEDIYIYMDIEIDIDI